MIRVRLSFLLLSFIAAWVPTVGQAQVLRLGGEEEAAARAAAELATKESTSKEVRFHAAAEVQPAMKYEFSVPSIRRQPDNAVVHILRAHVLLNQGDNPDLQRQWYEKHPDALELPIAQFPREEAREYLRHFAPVLKELYQAERAEDIDYDIRVKDLRGRDVYDIVLPEIQQARDLARLIELEAILAISEKRFDDAIQSLRNGFRLAEITDHMGKHFIVGKLVAIAIHSTMLGNVELMIRQPDSPNMYWALASLPNSMGDMREAFASEQLALENTLEGVMQLPTDPLADAAWQQRLVTTVANVLHIRGELIPGIPGDEPVAQRDWSRLFGGLIVLFHGESSKHELRGRGVSVEQVAAMSYSEAVIRVTQQQLQSLQSNYYKWALVPYTVANLKRPEEQLALTAQNPLQPAALVAGLVFPGIEPAIKAGDRVVTKRNQLITLEAIRAYAAANENKLPESLDDLEPVPAWRQAGSGEAFRYKRVSEREAVLQRERYWPHDEDAELQLILAP